MSETVLLGATNGSHEKLRDPLYTLQTPEEFRDDFVRLANQAGPTDMVGFETMQFEVCNATDPIFQALKDAEGRGVQDVRFHYDRVAREHIRDPETGAQAWFRPKRLGAWAVYSSNGNQDSLKKAFQKREELIRGFEESGITDPAFRSRGNQPRLSHNHVKLAIVGDTAWFGTMNQRAIDYEMSNFMLKVTDPSLVAALKDVFEQTELRELGDDKVFAAEDRLTGDETQLLLDVGEKRQSVIYDKAVAMITSLQPGDSFTMIGQWPPVKSMYGRLANELQAKMANGSRAEFLLSPEEFLHPSRIGAKIAKRRTDAMVERLPSMSVIHLPQQTHAKAILVERVDGRMEALMGSHNFTSWTVNNGTRELAMWTKNPAITTQVKDFLANVRWWETR